MAKKLKQDEVGDSDELQALFDSIASNQSQPAPAPVAARAAPAPAGDSGGDDAELQALFDSVAADFDAGAVAEKTAAPAAPAASAATAAQSEHSCDAVFTRIGQMTRQVHNTLRELGTDDGLQDAVQAIPDARQRLTYIAQMTEQAASRVLNATDIAQPIQGRIQSGAAELQARWDKLFANQLSVQEFKALSGETRSFLGEVVEGSRATNAQLMEIMMAQDFQDLTGQVIKKVVDLAQKLETELLQVLLEVTPAEKRGDKHSGLMNGPVVSTEGRDDVVTTQEQVDDLLDSLGF
ncbi:MAG: chemotaxis protein CheZ [Azoarcus sp.]|uniref:Protein phosphatase CheZ n=1 Tax=Aromatoleum tolulyticum TaxID=34027 RepID=A0A1N7AJD7_9RHOO|nr:protein phosphatase CheZ [Aromatoleum tolulyticum]MCK9985878.1 chemotaxis protein CheZ [Azoarcus sp.]SIR39176.1 chemotaxis protein CheZ [Aromatoleum tolulyticum]